MDEELPRYIEKFIDGDLQHYYESELNRPRGLVRELTADNFKKMVMEDESVE